MMNNYVNPKSSDLATYVDKQIKHFFPIGNEHNLEIITKHIPETMQRIITCINGVKPWKENEFHLLHSSQYCIFLWYLSNTIWKHQEDGALPTKIFYLNKALNGFECFYDNNLPDVFFIGHSVGIVLVRNTYPKHLVLYQGVTVGKSFDATPRIGERVILYPHCAIIGNSVIEDGSVLSQGVSVLNQTTQKNSIVFQKGRDLVFKSHDESIFKNYFRI